VEGLRRPSSATAASLDPENAQAYVEMLRRALTLGGFQQVVFVSHQVTEELLLRCLQLVCGG